MPLLIMSFFGDAAKAPLSDTDLENAFSTGKKLAPAGCKVEARALDRTMIEIFYQPDADPQIVLDDADRLPLPISAGVVSVWMEDAIDNVELVTQNLSRQLHDALQAVGTGTFDARRHLDLVGEGETPTLQAFVVIERRADLDRDTFIQYYRTQHVPLAKRLKPRFTRYTTCRTLEKFGDFPADCVTIQEYPSLDELRQHLRTRTADGDEAVDDIQHFMSHVVYNIGERTTT